MPVKELDWKVIQRKPTTCDRIPIPGFKANLRETDNRVLGVVTDWYTVVQNKDAFAFTDTLLGEGITYETAGSPKNGRRRRLDVRIWLPPAFYTGCQKDTKRSQSRIERDGINMEFCKFINSVKAEIAKLCGNKYKVFIQTILGNNGVRRAAISVKREENCGSLVYLGTYYESIISGEMSMQLIVKDIYNMFMTKQFPEIPKMELGDFEQLKGKATYRLVNQGLNEGLLNDVLYMPYCHLAIVFCLFLDSGGNSQMTSLIHEEQIRLWGTNVETLYRLAKENTPRLLSFSLKTMNEVLREIAQNHLRLTTVRA